MLVGTRGSYRLAEEIASGGTATVHLARHIGAAGFSRVVAIKRLHPHLAKDPEFRAMLTDEARLASRIHHPNVCAVLDVITEGDELALVLDYVAGASLAALTKRLDGPVPNAVAVAIACGVLSGLEAAHATCDDDGSPLSLVHRDVSPQNVLVGNDGTARLIDFGTAKAFGRITETSEGLVKGKIAYMAPEQISDGDVDQRTDLYATAVVLWEMLTGRRLFSGNGPATMLDVLEQPLATPSAAGAIDAVALDAVVMRGLARNPDDRFANAHDMASALEAAVTPATSRAVAEWVRSVGGPSSAPSSRLVAAAPASELTPVSGESILERRSSSAMLAASPRISTATAPAGKLGFDPSNIEMGVHDRDQTLAIYGPILLQVRVGEMTLAALNQIEALCRLALRRREGNVCLVAVLESTATMAGSGLRARQRKLFEDILLPMTRAHVCMLPTGKDISSTLMRSAARLYFRANDRVHFAATVDEGYTWIGSRVEVPPADVRAFVDHVRDVAQRKE